MSKSNDELMMDTMYWWGIPTLFRCPYKFDLNDYIINDLEIGDIQIHNLRTIHSSDYNNSNVSENLRATDCWRLGLLIYFC